MKRTAAVFVVMIVSLAIFLSWFPSVKPVSAQNVGYSISSIDHEIQIMNSGNVIIKDTIQVTGQLQGDFLIGFPYKYGSYVLKAEAYDANEVLNVSLGVPLGSRNGYYGASVSFPQGAPQVFTVIFILSNSLVTATNLGYSVDFPAYPSLVTDVSFCNVTLVIPSLSTNMSIIKSDGEVDGVTNFVKNNLTAYTYSPATLNFNLVTGYIQLSDLQTLNRQITLSPTGMVTCSDSYSLLNDQPTATSGFIFNLPLNASNIVASQLDTNLTVAVANDDSGRPTANVTLLQPLNHGETTDLTLEYTLLRVVPQKTSLFTLNLDLFSDLQYYVDQASITINPPEGARFTAPTLNSAGASYTLTRDIFQQTFTINLAGVSFADSLSPSTNISQVTYDFSPLWISFGPTLWTWTIAVVVSMILIVWKRPRTQATQKIFVPKWSAGISPDQLATFADTYKEKSRVASELKSLEYRAQKGRIPRRRYKVQRRTLEARLETLSQNIKTQKELLRSAGGSYADLVRQLENAEMQIEEVETNTSSIEARHSRGELSLEEYKKLQVDYQRRKEKAETTINGILLRLREEIH